MDPIDFFCSVKHKRKYFEECGTANSSGTLCIFPSLYFSYYGSQLGSNNNTVSSQRSCRRRLRSTEYLKKEVKRERELFTPSWGLAEKSDILTHSLPHPFTSIVMETGKTGLVSNDVLQNIFSVRHHDVINNDITLKTHMHIKFSMRLQWEHVVKWNLNSQTVIINTEQLNSNIVQIHIKNLKHSF